MVKSEEMTAAETVLDHLIKLEAMGSLILESKGIPGLDFDEVMERVKRKTILLDETLEVMEERADLYEMICGKELFGLEGEEEEERDAKPANWSRHWIVERGRMREVFVVAVPVMQVQVKGRKNEKTYDAENTAEDVRKSRFTMPPREQRNRSFSA